MKPTTDPVRPLAGRDGEPQFDEPWQAQTLAVAARLVEAGKFSASEWSDSLGMQIAKAKDAGEPDDAQTYYACALKALEALTGSHGLVSAGELKQREQAWAEAFMATPHGQPVVLPESASKS